VTFKVSFMCIYNISLVTFQYIINNTLSPSYISLFSILTVGLFQMKRGVIKLMKSDNFA